MILIKECSVDDLMDYQKISRQTYWETFAGMNTQANMQAYLEEAFNLEKLRSEWLNEASFFYFIFCNEQLAGYMKLNEGKAQTDLHDPLSLEVERIYVLKDFQGNGLGWQLMDKAVALGKARKLTYLWLGVWEDNKKALSFYQKHNFYKIGSHDFIMGDEIQTDYLMRKDLIIDEKCGSLDISLHK
ncbi:GNAT family N-acetyltransferase [Acetobacterium malicum]|uniref:GNAT family N-acetyltransferase n=1 Tax=Acetobacterium malicum TaxID=52692 RepID=UPI00041397E0|nr:GNAT family N-acetyltransferase [Acetobacterium dehalogenans]